MTVIKAADLFCGAGGFSTGAVRTCRSRGMSIDLTAINHWDVAIATHTKNHPGARHLCADVYRLSPREAVPKGSLDLLMASPTCTFFSRARGGKPISRDQRYGRMTPTQVIRWASELKAGAVVVENVPEFQDWGPVDVASGKPKRAKRGQYFRAWRRKLERMGFRVEHRVLNAADYGDATTRQRLFLIGRRDGGSVRWPTPTHSERGSGDLFGAGEQRWRPAREIIDWSIPGRSIFGRKKPLSLKTLNRIYAGAERFGWPRAFLVVLRQHMDALELSGPLPTITAGGTHIGLAQPMVLPQHSGGAMRSTDEPLPTVTTDGAHALVVPYYATGVCQRVSDPLPTVTTKARFGLVKPERRQDGPDILFRMFQPHELAASMGFEGYEFTGTKTDVIRQIGNAVPVNTAAALVGAVLGAS